MVSSILGAACGLHGMRVAGPGTRHVDKRLRPRASSPEAVKKSKVARFASETRSDASRADEGDAGTSERRRGEADGFVSPQNGSLWIFSQPLSAPGWR